MGIVIKQSFWASAIIYLGVSIGYINSLILLPYFLDAESYGLVRLIQSNGMILIPLALIGMNGSFIKFFPKFKDDPILTTRIFSFQLFVVLVGSIVFSGLIFIFHKPIEAFYAEKSSLYNDYLWATVVIFVAQSIFNYFTSIAWSKFNIILTNFLNEIVLRLLSTSLIVLYGYEYITFPFLIMLLCASYCIVTVALFVYLMIKYNLKFDWGFINLDREWIKQSFKFGSYTMLVTSSGSILLNVGYLLTASYIGLEASGILTISVYIGTMVELPKRSLLQIISPIITQDFNDNNIKSLGNNYQKSSINLGLLGILISIGIIVNLDSLFELIPNGEIYLGGYWLIVVICLSKFINMIGGVSAEIMTYSSFYKYNYIISPLSAIMIIVLNVIMINQYGIIGAGYSTLITVIVSQTIRQIIIYWKLGIAPYHFNHIKLILIGAITYFIVLAVPILDIPMIDIVVRSIIATVLFIGLIYWLKISMEINNILKMVFSKIGISL